MAMTTKPKTAQLAELHELAAEGVKLFAINKLIQTLDKQAHSFNTIASQ